VAAPAAAGAWVIPSGTVDGRGAAQTKRRLDAELTFYVVEAAASARVRYGVIVIVRISGNQPAVISCAVSLRNADMLMPTYSSSPASLKCL